MKPHSTRREGGVAQSLGCREHMGGWQVSSGEGETLGYSGRADLGKGAMCLISWASLLHSASALGPSPPFFGGNCCSVFFPKRENV